MADMVRFEMRIKMFRIYENRSAMGGIDYNQKITVKVTRTLIGG